MSVKSIVLTSIVLCIAVSTATRVYARPPAGAFDSLLARTSMQFRIPKGYTPVPVVPNDDVAYDYAIKSDSVRLEIRYRIMPVEKAVPGGTNPNGVYQSMLYAMMMNISGGKEGQIAHYHPTEVKAEFGADAGSSTTVRNNSAFGNGFRFSILSVIHKENVADAYAFYLCDDPQIALAVLQNDAVFHALKFR